MPRKLCICFGLSGLMSLNFGKGWFLVQNRRLYFWGNLDKDPDTGFFIRLIVICEIALVCKYSLGVSTIMPTTLVTNLISMVCSSLTL